MIIKAIQGQERFLFSCREKRKKNVESKFHSHRISIKKVIKSNFFILFFFLLGRFLLSFFLSFLAYMIEKRSLVTLSGTSILLPDLY